MKAILKSRRIVLWLFVPLMLLVVLSVAVTILLPAVLRVTPPAKV